MVEITKIEEVGNGVEVSLSNGRKHWVSNDSWTTKEELKQAIIDAENFIEKKKTPEEKTAMQELVGETLE